MMRRIVITVCPRERGTVKLPLRRRGPRIRMDALAIARHLTSLVESGGIERLVTIRQACAGGCSGPGPNVSLTLHPLRAPGEPEDEVAVGWKSYVASLATLPCLADVIDDNLPARTTGGTRDRRAAPSARPRRRRRRSAIRR